MPTKLVSIIAATTAAAAMLTPTASYAQADSAAYVDKDVGCGLPGWLVGVPGNLRVDDTVFVSTGSGNSQLTCTFVIPEGLEPERATNASGFKCRVKTRDGMQITTKTRAYATPGGKAFLSCQAKKS